MKLKDFLEWEVPQGKAGRGMSTLPLVWLIRPPDDGDGSIKLTINKCWLAANEPAIVDKFQKKVAKIEAKSVQVGLGVSIDRVKKEVFLVFDPPADMSQYVSSYDIERTGNISLLNRVLGDDLWTLLDVDTMSQKQFLTIDLFETIEDKNVYKLTYDGKSEQNKNARVTFPMKRVKK